MVLTKYAAVFYAGAVFGVFAMLLLYAAVRSEK